MAKAVEKSELSACAREFESARAIFIKAQIKNISINYDVTRAAVEKVNHTVFRSFHTEVKT